MAERAPGIDLAVIGGTGVYALDGLELAERRSPRTPFGVPASPLTLGRWRGASVAFLARHGEQHSVLPHAIEYRANVWAVAQVRPARVVALNAVGSLDRRLPPGSVGLPDQLIDYTWGRAGTFSGELPEAPMHVDFTDPYDRSLRAALEAAAGDLLAASRDLVYGVCQGPRLETAAEIRRLARDGCGVVGMTGMPEAALARELGLPYACLCLSGNWAAGFAADAGEITLEEVIENVGRATGRAWSILERLVAPPTTGEESPGAD